MPRRPPSRLFPEQMHRAVLRRIESASLAAVNYYVARPYPGRVTPFRATKQPAGYRPDRRLGWSRIAQGGVEVYDVPGYHGAIVYEPRIQVLAEQLKLYLAAEAPRRRGARCETSFGRTSDRLAAPRLSYREGRQPR